MADFDERYMADRISDHIRIQNAGMLVGAIVIAAVAFFGGTMVVQGRPIVQKNVTETKCDKTQLERDATGARDVCYNSRVIDFHYEDDGKGNKTVPVVKCKE